MIGKTTVFSCDEYNSTVLREKLEAEILKIDDLSWIRPGITIGIKANLVAAKKPEEAATTHPEAVKALAEIFVKRGAKVLIGDSPGGLFTPRRLETVYQTCGYLPLETDDIQLNYDCSYHETTFPDAVVASKFSVTSWIEKCDYLVSFAKMKSHGMMGMSGAVKNMFGVIPGTQKPEYHFLYPDTDQFANMIVDIASYTKPKLSLIDGIVGMEGNGPTAGSVKHCGVMIVSTNVFDADLCMAKIIQCPVEQAPILKASINRGLTSKNITEPDLIAQIKKYQLNQFERPVSAGNFWAERKGVWKLLAPLLQRKPKVEKKECIKCGRCAEVCPAKAIRIGSYPSVDYSACIRCFCCQEFCPVGAMKVHRSKIASILTK